MQSRSNADQEEIFRRWFDQHLGLILKVVRGCAVGSSDQDDLLQDVLLQLWSSIPAFRGESKETTWIYRVAFNTALAWRRGERRRREGQELLLNSDPATLFQASPAGSREQEIVEQLYAAIHQLPKVDISLALMHLNGLTYREMAEVLGISENYIGVRLNRIRKQLAEHLKGAGNGL